MTLRIGDPAPDFSAPDQDGKIHRLIDARGKWLLLYFYPKDDTPGCTAEACGFRDAYADKPENVLILGVSADSVASHGKFRDKYHLPFTILADPKKEIIAAYGANGLIMNKRVSFLINPEGVIAKIYPKVSPQDHAAEVLQDVAVLASQRRV